MQTQASSFSCWLVAACTETGWSDVASNQRVWWMISVCVCVYDDADESVKRCALCAGQKLHAIVARAVRVGMG